MADKLSHFIFFLFLSMSFNVPATEKFSCDELEESIDDLDDIAEGFHAAGDIREGDAVDVALRDVVDSLHIYAAVEKEGNLSYYVNEMELAWQNMDGNNFSNALEGVIESMEQLLRRDCY